MSTTLHSVGKVVEAMTITTRPYLFTGSVGGQFYARRTRPGQEATVTLNLRKHMPSNKRSMVIFLEKMLDDAKRDLRRMEKERAKR